MSFATKVTERVELADGQHAVVRKLGWKALKDARDAKMLDAAGLQRALGADFQVQMRKALGNTPEEVAKRVEELKKLGDSDPFITHDQAVLLERGVVSWSFEVPINAENIAELDEPDAEALARKVYELSRPKTEAERKNS